MSRVGFSYGTKILPQNDKEGQTTMMATTSNAADTDNDTSFEIDDPEDEEFIEEQQMQSKKENGQGMGTTAAEDINVDDGMSTPTNDLGKNAYLEHRKSISTLLKKSLTSVNAPKTEEDEKKKEIVHDDHDVPCGHVVAKTLSPQQSSLSHSLRRDSNSDDDIDSDVSCDDSYTFSSTPTTADVADVSTGNLNRYSNGSGGSSNSYKLRKHLTTAGATGGAAATLKQPTSASPYQNDDNNSGSLATTTTELDIDQQQQQQHQQQQQQHQQHSSQSNHHLRRSSSIRVNPTVLNIPTMLLTHPSAALQENTTLKVSNSFEIPTTSGGGAFRHHQRTLSSASHRSVTSQHSVHTANTSLTIVEPKSRIWSSLSWICVRFQSSGIGAPSVHHAMVVIFLEFFAWGLLTMPVISVLNQTFPEHTFLMNGLVMGIKGILSFLSAPLIGALSDIWGRKFFLLITVFFTCAPIPLMTINTWWFFAMISISGIFAVTFSVVFAYVADVTTLEERSRAYGLVSATFAASLVISPALGAVLMERYGDTLVVALATAIAVLDVFFILVAVPESLPDKVRPSSWGAPINWEQADPFAALRKVGTDHTILMQCVTVLLSYLPEAGQYSCIFVYLKLKMGFNSMEVAIFIAVVGILSISVQVTLGCFMRKIGAKRTIILGLLLETTQLFWYGFGSTKWMMWAAGILAALGSITYPAISAFVSIHSTADSQGAVQGMVTGMRGLCNGLGPAMFGVVFYLFNVDLNNEQSVAANAQNDKWFNFPGPPFVFGGFMVILAILVALFIPEVHGDANFNRTPSEKKRASVDVQYEVEAGHKPTSPLMRSESLAQL